MRAVFFTLMLAFIFLGSVAAIFKIRLPSDNVYYPAVKAVQVAGFEIERRIEAALNVDSTRVASGDNVAAGAPNRTPFSSCRLVQAADIARPAIRACRI
jgi:hypothetical protein